MLGWVRVRWGTLAGLGVSVVVLGLLVGGVGLAQPVGHAARKTRKFTETANMHLVKKKGAILKESGTATGTLSGTAKARLDTSLLPVKVTGTVTFYPYSGDSLTFTVVGYPQSTKTIAKFTGFMGVKKGTGRYASATGSGTLSGTVNRDTWAFTVHAIATLTY